MGMGQGAGITGCALRYRLPHTGLCCQCNVLCSPGSGEVLRYLFAKRYPTPREVRMYSGREGSFSIFLRR